MKIGICTKCEKKRVLMGGFCSDCLEDKPRNTLTNTRSSIPDLSERPPYEELLKRKLSGNLQERDEYWIATYRAERNLYNR